MKKIFTTLCLIGLFALISIPSVAQRTRKSTQRVKVSKPSVVFSYGTTDGQIYTNDFLGMKFSIPEDYVIQDRELEEILVKSGKNERKIKFLLVARNSNSNFDCAALKLSPSIRNMTAKQILQAHITASRNSATPPNVSFSPRVEQGKFGSNVLAFVDTVSKRSKQRIYVIVKKGYLITFILTYFDESELETMNSILAEADLNWKKF